MRTSIITAIVSILALWLTSCATVTTETVNPDGSKTTTTSTTVDPAAAAAIANAAAQAALDRAQGNAEVHSEK